MVKYQQNVNYCDLQLVLIMRKCRRGFSREICQIGDLCEPPGAGPHTGWCGERGVIAPGYRILCRQFRNAGRQHGCPGGASIFSFRYKIHTRNILYTYYKVPLHAFHILRILRRIYYLCIYPEIFFAPLFPEQKSYRSSKFQAI